VRSEPHELQRILVGLAVDQHQVGADMAVAAVVPGAAQAMIVKAGRQRRAGAKQIDRFGQQVVLLPSRPFFSRL
jgi:hypothetical protein